MKVISIRAALCLALVLNSIVMQALAQVILSGTSYSQNFNALSSSGSANSWVDGVTIPGWYASAAGTFGGDYRAGSGTSTTGDLYSFGNDTDRSLGSLASGTTRELAYGVRLKNSGDVSLSQFSFGFAVEQWRDSGTSPQSLQFSYRLGTGPFSSADAANPPGSGGWTEITSLSFTSPQHAGAGALDGNTAANRTVFNSSSLSGIRLEPGQELFLRWFDGNDTGNDHGFGIDDFSLQFTPVPEPAESATVVSALLLGGAIFIRWKSRRKSLNAD